MRALDALGLSRGLEPRGRRAELVQTRGHGPWRMLVTQLHTW
jgi:hypothetical protein